MKVLLDTQLLLWALTDDDRLSKQARDILLDPEVEAYVSQASFWEIAVKESLDRLPLSSAKVFEAIDQSGFVRLAVTDEHLAELSRLPWKHKDPHARVLVAQSIIEPMKLLTTDWRLAAYGGPILLL